jgi:hypothetical protein
MSEIDHAKLDASLSEAVKAGDAPEVERLLRLGARDTSNKSLFYMASHMKYFEITRLLTEYTQDIGRRPCTMEQIENNVLIAGQE